MNHQGSQLPSPRPRKGGCGRPRSHSDQLFLKALVIRIVKHLPQVNTLLAALARDDERLPQTLAGRHSVAFACLFLQRIAFILNSS